MFWVLKQIEDLWNSTIDQIVERWAHMRLDEQERVKNLKSKYEQVQNIDDARAIKADIDQILANVQGIFFRKKCITRNISAFKAEPNENHG